MNEHKDERIIEIEKALEQGWALTPLDGKKAMRKNWQSEGPLDLETLVSHKGNIGLRTGRPSGVFVIDVDTAKGGEVPTGLPRTVTVNTGGGGQHYYFVMPDDVQLRNSQGKLAPHVDTRGQGGQVVFPGSIHPETGVMYRWADGLSPDDIDMAPLPDFIKEKLTMARAPKQSKKVPMRKLTDVEGAKLLLELHGDDLFHSTSLGWLVWNGVKWCLNEKQARRRAVQLGQEILEKAGVSKKTKARVAVAARHLESSSGMEAVLKIAQSMRELDGDLVEWDNKPWLVNFPNGTLDLKTGLLYQHSREDHLTQQCHIPYKPEAEAPRWERFLAEVFDDKQDLIDYLQWWAGYSLTGATDHQVFAIAYGNGANGKSTLVNTLMRIIGGEYASQMDPELLLQQRYSKHPTELASLRGKRFAVGHEIDDGRAIDSARIKQLTGGDSVRARQLYKEGFNFTPQMKLVICTNHLPNIRDHSAGMWRRVRLIPFTREFKEHERDSRLMETLSAESEGILAWIVKGALRCAAEGEPELPEAVKMATAQYENDQDTVAEFLASECVREPGAKVEKSVLYTTYSAFMSGHCEGRKAFMAHMKGLGYSETRMTGGRHGFSGIRLRLVDEPSDIRKKASEAVTERLLNRRQTESAASGMSSNT